MARVVVRLKDGEGDPVHGTEVTLWWKGFMLPESSSSEYTDSDGEASFDYSTDNMPGDQVSIYVNGAEFSGYHSPEDYYEFTVG